MAFDLSTAKPMNSGFDLSTARAVAPVNSDTPLPGWGDDYSPTIQAQKKQETTPSERAVGLGETGLTLVTGATGGTAGMLYGTLKGLADAIRSGKYGTNEGADLVERTAMEMANKLTYQPRTQAGQEYVSDVGETLSPLQAIPSVQGELMALSNIARQTVPIAPAIKQQARQTPALQYIEQKAAPVIETVKPAVEAVKQAVPDIKNITLIPNTKFKQKIAEDIKAGKTDKRLATYMLSGYEKVKTDSVAKESIKQGFDPGVISAIKGASEADRHNMVKMVENMQKGKQDALFAMKNRPSDVAGDSLLKRVQFVKSTNREAGKQLDDVAKSLRGQNIDFDAPMSNFMNNLDEIGVSLDENLNPIFAGSDIEGLSGPQSAVRGIVKRLASGKTGNMPDAYELHRMKKYIDEIVTYGKQGEGLSGKTERILKQLRADLDGALDNQFTEYNRVNSTYSDTVNSLNALQDVAGKKMDLFGPNADKAVGVLLRRLMSNVQSRVNLVDAIDSLESTARKYGGSFNDDINVQMLFADELDNVFGPVARTSLAGETAKGFKKGAETVVGQRNMTSSAIDAAGAGIEKLRGINEENAFKAINELLKRKK